MFLSFGNNLYTPCPSPPSCLDSSLIASWLWSRPEAHFLQPYHDNSSVTNHEIGYRFTSLRVTDWSFHSLANILWTEYRERVLVTIEFFCVYKYYVMSRYYLLKNRRSSCQFLSTRREKRIWFGKRKPSVVAFIAVISVPGRYHQRYHYYRACTLSVSFVVRRWKLMINFPSANTLSIGTRLMPVRSLASPRLEYLATLSCFLGGLAMTDCSWHGDVETSINSRCQPLVSTLVVPQTSIDRVNLVQRYWTWTLDVFSFSPSWNKLLSTGWW